ncbi:hypothetical protein GCM10009865_11760 [Aeromicrobium ponti]|uniref:DUF6094 domain-containing protein n=1 Tax=Cytobacillus oceanisediminis TaxID=665099 RepID=A0A562K381_9BACI|nr:DUF6094 domain-containing protein [Cytobacillus oceanisediminis]TWH89806.1 hypothetical protein IQ19_01054 [Cytobacillus oceanisediminis]
MHHQPIRAWALLSDITKGKATIYDLAAELRRLGLNFSYSELLEKTRPKINSRIVQRGGYYPTPLKELQLILPHLAVNASEVTPFINAYDPCCGEGEAIHCLGEHIKTKTKAEVTTFGVELERTRCETAATVLKHVVNDGYETVRTEAKYGVMWLNPPYDDVFKERTELVFLKTLSSTSKNVLQQGALLMFCIPQHVLNDCAPILGSRFKDVKVYRFTDDNFPVYDQVVVFAYFKKPTYQEQRETIE